ncbi:MAG: hypothetical protein R2862_09770 [Thermoanaerobaculia bacterium]
MATDRAAPLLRPLRWGLAAHGVEVAHAAAVALDGRALLLAGRGGSGKSTLSVAALLGGFELLGDDYVALGAEGEPHVHALFATAKLDAASLARLPELGDAAPAAPAPGEKAVLPLGPLFTDRLPSTRPLAAIVAPRLGEAPALRRIGPAEALRRLAPSTLFQLPGSDVVAFGRLAALVRRLPAFELTVGPQPRAALDLLASLAREGTNG